MERFPCPRNETCRYRNSVNDEFPRERNDDGPVAIDKTGTSAINGRWILISTISALSTHLRRFPAAPKPTVRYTRNTRGNKITCFPETKRNFDLTRCARTTIIRYNIFLDLLSYAQKSARAFDIFI